MLLRTLAALERHYLTQSGQPRPAQPLDWRNHHTP